ncbi:MULTISPECIES: chromosomal replication initiator protein DnaA [unclassified Pseudodesulfovibrio]|uniref:chromosomal replication initiator protein DnaA n=1 Tax=unclassified Pseudodesulfovibrio TaxID=2661612 RepID=UPI000FEBBBD4|nr:MULTISPECIES: chromosomal replication initiator protein DnaA [unclassified Pseudodesulfovibrio]MCJ2163126.1 chromosomal replication initiator protein DnaA [Pseudodesulfovibrio sp. S3-i]RWU07118.1 chromosomal replication initiator protein DnaA [Pseudodesulfovibrio sp. S3]
MIDTAWKQILHSLEKSLNPGLFTVWIKPLIGRVEGSKLTLSAPNEFVANWVRDRLLQVIRESAAEVLGGEPRITINVRAREAGSLAAKPERKKKPEAEKAPRHLGLPLGHSIKPVIVSNWRFSFDDFVVGPSNELACAASKSMSSSIFNSDHLFLSSGAGLGKTHLLQSVGNQLCRSANRKNLKVACLSSEEFATRWVMSFKSGQVDQFKSLFREGIDVLLMEDVHFFQGKEKMQEELLCTLTALRERGCKVVLTSSFMPKEFMKVDDRLVSRFCSGFLAHINKPDMETRRRIILEKARRMQVDVPVEVSELLAERITSDIRQLESCLNNLVLKARLLNRAVTMSLAWEVLDNYAVQNSAPDFDQIIDFICKSYSLSKEELRAKSRKRQVVLARNTAFYLARKHTDLSLKSIGDRLGRKHSTVLKGITKVEREISKQTPLGRQIESTAQRLTP